MIQVSPKKRPTIEQILAHPWMQGPEATDEEINADFANRQEVLNSEAKRERDQKREERRNAETHRRIFRGAAQQNEDCDEEFDFDSLETLEVEEYGPVYVHNRTDFFTTSPPIDVIIDLMNHFKDP